VEVSGSRVRLRLGDNYELNDGVARLRILLEGVAVVEEDSAALAARVIGDEDGDDAITAADAWLASGDRSQALRAAARTLLVQSGGGEVLRTFAHTDHQGSVVALSDDAGQVTERFAYYPYGGIKHSSAVQSESAAYTGKRFDASGLVDFGVRQLLPREGRFLSPDPSFLMVSGGIVEKGPSAFSTYALAGNNPVTLIDVNGQFPWKKAALYGAGAVVVGGAVAAGIMTGVLPALVGAAVATAAAATVANIAGAIIGGVVGGVGEALANRERLKLKYPAGNVPMKEYVQSTMYVVGRALTGAFSGFFSYGLSAISSAASDVVTISTFQGKVSPAKAAVAKIVIGAAGGLITGGVDSLLSASTSSVSGFGGTLKDIALEGAQSAGTAAVTETVFAPYFAAEAKSIRLEQQFVGVGRSRSDAFSAPSPDKPGKKLKKKRKKRKKKKKKSTLRKYRKRKE
jgi:RHS repeat-associated protein